MEIEFSRKYQIINEVLNAVTHGIAALLSLFCFNLLMDRAHTTLDYVAFAIMEVRFFCFSFPLRYFIA